MIDFDFPKAKRRFMVGRGHIDDSATDAQVSEAYTKYQKEHPEPLMPSRDDPTKEAECLICRDAEFVYAVFHGKADYSKVIACECYEGKHKEELESWRFGQTYIPPSKKVYNFNSFIPVREADEAFKAAADLGTGKANFKLLMIYGPNGNGKTHLAVAAALERHYAGGDVKFTTVSGLLSRLRKAMEQTSYETTSQILDEMKECEFLVLDELAHKETEWTESVIEEIINWRYMNELDTIVTMDKDIKSLSEPILSRFRDGRISMIVENEAGDYRPKLKRGKE